MYIKELTLLDYFRQVCPLLGAMHVFFCPSPNVRPLQEDFGRGGICVLIWSKIFSEILGYTLKKYFKIFVLCCPVWFVVTTLCFILKTSLLAWSADWHKLLSKNGLDELQELPWISILSLAVALLSEFWLSVKYTYV